MRRWKEPIEPKFCVSREPGDPSKPPAKMYRQHETDVVLAGVQDGPWFYPEYRLYRHFVDGDLVESRKGALEPGEEVPQERQSEPLLQQEG